MPSQRPSANAYVHINESIFLTRDVSLELFLTPYALQPRGSLHCHVMTPIKQANFHEVKTEQLFKLWLLFSRDPTVGIAQKSDIY